MRTFHHDIHHFPADDEYDKRSDDEQHDQRTADHQYINIEHDQRTADH